jgi:hypothetical protein
MCFKTDSTCGAGLNPALHVESVLKHVTLFSGLKLAPHVKSVLKHVTLFSGLKPAPHVEWFHTWSRLKT